MTVVLYWMSISHPSQVARKMMDLKGVEYELVDVVPMNQRIHLRLAGFSRGTVPALKLDGQRTQGSRRIARALDAHWPEPPLFPADPTLRARVEEAERWGEEQLQPIPPVCRPRRAGRLARVRRTGARAVPPLPRRAPAVPGRRMARAGANRVSGLRLGVVRCLRRLRKPPGPSAALAAAPRIAGLCPRIEPSLRQGATHIVALARPPLANPMRRRVNG